MDEQERKRLAVGLVKSLRADSAPTEEDLAKLAASGFLKEMLDEEEAKLTTPQEGTTLAKGSFLSKKLRDFAKGS